MSINESILQNYRLIWLDSKINQTDEHIRHSIVQLRSLVNTIHVFTDVDQCIDFLTGIFFEKIFLIASKDCIQSIVFLIHDILQVNEIFVIADSQISDEQWIEDWWKIKGIFSHVDSIYTSLEESIHLSDRNMISISLISVDHTLDFNLNKFDQSFIYSHIIKDILSQLDYQEQSVKDFVIYCRNIFANNSSVMDKINKFEEEYRLHTHIGWYTSENFICSMLNRALRTHEINTIVKMGFFISGMHQQIQKLHSIQFSDKQDSLTVYRGQSLFKDQFNKLLECKDGFISFNQFLSTTEDRQVAFALADNRRSDTNSVGVLFRINVNTHTSTTPYARIDEFINNNDKQQVIFSMHSIFHIDDIKTSEESDQIWIVDLKMISDNEPLLKVLTKRLRQEAQDATGWHRLGQLLAKLEHFDKAEEVYNMLVHQCTSDNSEKATLFNHLGNIRQKQGDYVTAIIYYEKELRILDKLEPKYYPRIIDGYNNIGLMFLELEYYPSAFSYFRNNVGSSRINLS